ncbi:MAG: AsmA-like C-terminal domain-containing protein [Candidatus Omnitrophota bacterium]
MKIFLIVIISVLILLVLAIAVFALTFDANRYKDLLITKLEESMNRDLTIDNISINLWHGLGIEAKGVVIKDRNKTWNDPLLTIKSLNVSVEILPLLKKDIQIQRLRIPDLSINTGSGTNFRCALDLKVNILINSLSQEDMLKTLNAKGNMKADNAVLENMNVLKAALDKLNMLPDLVQKLKDKLPEKYSKLLDQNYTAFKPMDAGFEIRDTRIYFDKLLVKSDAFYLASKGSVGMLDQSLAISSNFFIPKDLSGAFISAVPELGYLADNEGLITMPLEIKGKVPDVSIMPNLNYVLQKLIASKGQELLNKLFRNK